MRKTPEVKGLIGPALLIAIIFVSPSVASLSTSAIAQGPNLGKNNTTAGNMTGGNTTSSSSALHKPYKCLLIHVYEVVSRDNIDTRGVYPDSMTTDP